jgi:hypothetical protein
MEIDGEHERAQRMCQSDKMAVEAVALVTVSVLASIYGRFGPNWVILSTDCERPESALSCR